jgi:hypothetical protein
VTANLEHEGYEVTCIGCGHTAKLRFPLPEGNQALRPDCMRTGRISP